jgi:FkbM family methyltransferase
MRLRERLERLTGTVRGLADEARAGRHHTADLRSFLRFLADILLYRVLFFVDLPGSGRERQLRLRHGVEITYRLNRGDLQAIREVWLDETYRLPVELAQIETLIDLGANIGLTSLYLGRRHGCSNILAVEPDPSNARLARINLERNGLPGEVVEAAVAPRDGIAYFDADRNSLFGRVATTGRPVQAISMHSLLRRIGGSADLLKLDIEGGEAALLEGGRGWLADIRALMVEFHPDRVDYPGLVALLQEAGYRYLPAGSVHPKSADTFLRDS